MQESVPHRNRFRPIPGTRSTHNIRDPLEIDRVRQIPEFLGIPTDSGIPGSGSDSEIANRNHTILLTRICDVVLISYSIWTRSNSVTELRELRQDGIEWNWTEFRPIPEFRELIPIPELHGIPTDSGIPGTGSDSGIANRNHTILLTRICDVVLISYSIWTRSNSVTEFRELRQEGIERNS